MNIFQKVVLKNLRQNKTRTIVTIVGILLSVAMFTAVTACVSSSVHFLRATAKRMNGDWHCNISVSEAERESILTDESIEKVTLLESIGYARIEEISNPDKPYLFLGGMDENAAAMLPIRITEGRLPENSSELLVPDHLATNGNVHYTLGDTLRLDIGDRVSEGSGKKIYTLYQQTPYTYEEEELALRFTKEYTVVGFYERPYVENYSAPGYTSLTISDPAVSGSGHYTAYLQFSDPGDAIPWIRKDSHYEEDAQFNYDLLRFYGASGENAYTSVLYSLATILILIILFGSIALIYNAFSISMTERTKQFGLLSSLGATRRQLVHSVLFEAFALCVIGIPLGILSGIAGIGITLSLLGESIPTVIFGDQRAVIPLSLHVSAPAVLLAAAIGLCTVLISAFLPARKAARLSPIDAIRQTSDIAIPARRVKTSRLTYKAFGLPGMLASKNFKRNRKKYRATVISLFVSVVLFISASSFCTYLMDASEAIMSDSGYDLYFNYYPEIDSYTSDEILARVSNAKSVETAAYCHVISMEAWISPDNMNQDYLEFLDKEQMLTFQQTDEDELILQYVLIYFIDDKSYEKYLQEHGFSVSTYMNAEHPTALASDFIRHYVGDNGKYYTFHTLSEDMSVDFTLLQPVPPEGYHYSGYSTDEYGQGVYHFTQTDPWEIIELPLDECAVKKTATVGAVIEEPPFFLGDPYVSALILLYPASVMDAMLATPDGTAYDNMVYTGFYFQANNPKEAEESITTILNDMDAGYSGVDNYAERASNERMMLLIIMVFSYGFITLISLIAAANVFNTISTNIQLRCREFAMLRSTGMSPGGFRVMMCYECLLYGIKGLLYGLPVSLLITWVIYLRINEGWAAGFYVPWHSLAIAIGSVFVVVGATMIYSMKRLSRENIMDTLKNENI